MLDDYARRVEALERGECPRGRLSVRDAARALVEEVCARRWVTTEARTQAQRLVCRLERLLNPGIVQVAQVRPARRP
jgi:hypothetical protein